jgi:hypothetical protein
VEGCILFYSGGYHEIWNFYNKSGFVTQTLAQHLKAIVVFGEHRYFGSSLLENVTLEGTGRFSLSYFSIDQVLLDYVHLIKHVRRDLRA